MKTFLFKSVLISIMILSIVTISCNTKPKESKTFTESEDGKTVTYNRDSISYKLVKIGNQVWMAENFAYKSTTGCWAYDNDENNVSAYGYLYTLETAISICPDGWHVPSLAEWNELIDYLGGTSLAGNKMKEADGTHWNSDDYGNKEITNSSGFTALPGGNYDDAFSTFNYKGLYGFWWSAPLDPEDTYPNVVDLTGNYADIEIQSGSSLSGFSVRYIKD